MMLDPLSTGEYEELYLASVRVPLVLAVFLGLWGLVILVLQALEIDYSSVLRKASGASLLVLRCFFVVGVVGRVA